MHWVYSLLPIIRAIFGVNKCRLRHSKLSKKVYKLLLFLALYHMTYLYFKIDTSQKFLVKDRCLKSGYSSMFAT